MHLATLIRRRQIAAPAFQGMELVVGDLQTGAAGAEILIPPSIRVFDELEQPVEGFPVVAVITGGGGSGTALTGVTDASGIFAVGSWTLGASVGTNTLVFHAVGAINNPVTVTATGTSTGVTQLVAQAGTGQTDIPAGTAAPIDPVWRCLDAGDDPVEGVPVTFITLGNGSTVESADVSDVNGDVSCGVWTMGATAGVNTVECQALAADGTPLIVDISTTSVVGAASKLRFVQAPSAAGNTDEALPVQPILQATDASDNDVVDTGNVVVTVLSGTLVLESGGTIALDGSGRATYTALTLSPASGTGVLRFTRGSYHLDSGTITLAAPVPTQIRVVTQPPGAQVGALFTHRYEITDDNGTRVTSDNSTVLTAVLIDNTELAVMTGLTATCVAGLATFSSAVDSEGDYRVTISAGILTPVNSASFTITAAPLSNEPTGMTVRVGKTIGATDGLGVDLTLETLDTAFGTSLATHAALRWGTGGNNMKVRLISNQSWRDAASSAIPSCPNGLDRIMVCQFGTSSTAAGEKGNGAYTLPSAQKCLYARFYRLFSSNFYGHPAGAMKGGFYTLMQGDSGSKFYIDIKGAGAANTSIGYSHNFGDPPPGQTSTTLIAHPRNTWKLIEVLDVMESTTGAADGHVTIWADGVKIGQVTGIAWGITGGGGGTAFGTSQQYLHFWGGTATPVAVPSPPMFVVTGDGLYISSKSTYMSPP